MQNEKSFKFLISICQVLEKNQVQFLIVGGTAVIAHGYYRPTIDHDGNVIDSPDFDIWFNPRFLNYQNLLNAFDELGLDTYEAREDVFPNPKTTFFRFRPQ